MLHGSHSVFSYPNNRVSQRCPVPIDSDKRSTVFISNFVTLHYNGNSMETWRNLGDRAENLHHFWRIWDPMDSSGHKWIFLEGPSKPINRKMLTETDFILF
ncbi:hypothetical protein TNCV_936801 [Trichonephila clavipes]|nr:hypothetical protein TNCV_936801 [Trichonephila clavipes]